ncbi:unnamed protein product [Amoebophrya sp. A25]|nr:unnamed protein product [Amoebophrya sp. A25]|eukprot:GSA25T00007637001.1
MEFVVSKNIMTPDLGPKPVKRHTSADWLRGVFEEVQPRRDRDFESQNKVRLGEKRLETANGRRFFDEKEPIPIRLYGGDLARELDAAKAYAGVPKPNTKTETGALLIDCERLMTEVGPLKDLTNAIKHTENLRDLATLSFTKISDSGAISIVEEPISSDDEDDDAYEFDQEEEESHQLRENAEHQECPRGDMSSPTKQVHDGQAAAFKECSHGPNVEKALAMLAEWHGHFQSALSADPNEVGTKLLSKEARRKRRNKSGAERLIYARLRDMETRRDDQHAEWGRNALSDLRANGDEKLPPEEVRKAQFVFAPEPHESGNEAGTGAEEQEGYTSTKDKEVSNNEDTTATCEKPSPGEDQAALYAENAGAGAASSSTKDHNETNAAAHGTSNPTDDTCGANPNDGKNQPSTANVENNNKGDEDNVAINRRQDADIRRMASRSSSSFRFYALLLATRSVDANGNALMLPFGAANPIFIVKLAVDLWDSVLRDVPREVWPLEPIPFGLISPAAVAVPPSTAAPPRHLQGENGDTVAMPTKVDQRQKLSAAEKVQHVLRYLKRDVEIAAFPEDCELQGVMPKASAASFRNVPRERRGRVFI